MRLPLFILLVLGIFASGAGAVTVSGTIKYDKITYSRSATTAQTQGFVAAHGATVRAYNSTGGAELASTTVGADGTYSITATAASLRLTVESTSAQVIVGKSFSAGAVREVYTVTVTASSAAPSGVDLNIAATDVAGAFNILTQLVRGRDWVVAAGLNFSKNIQARWPGPNGTVFHPEADQLYIEIQDFASDPDHYDDDIILHEFAHLVAEFFSKDDSAGGSHTITSKVDIRLSWSEGLAHYLSSAIRGDSLHVDSQGSVLANGASVTTNFDIATPSSKAVGSENEWAVANVLWRAAQSSSLNNILSVITAFKSPPATLTSEAISMDLFYDIWPTIRPDVDLASIYADRSMLYAIDSLDSAGNSSGAPKEISTPSLFVQENLSFFGNGDKDYYRFQAEAGSSYHVETGLCRNGALTTLNLYANNLVNPIGTNSQRSGQISDTNSYFFLSASQNMSVIVEVQRFNSPTSNFGLGGSSYSRTAGRYGSYAFALTKAAGTGADPNLTSIPGNSISGADINPPTAVGGGGGGGSGGCFLWSRR